MPDRFDRAVLLVILAVFAGIAIHHLRMPAAPTVAGLVALAVVGLLMIRAVPGSWLPRDEEHDEAEDRRGE